MIAIPYNCRWRQDGKKQSKKRKSEQKWTVNLKFYWNKMCVKKINNENSSMPAC